VYLVCLNLYNKEMDCEMNNITNFQKEDCGEEGNNFRSEEEVVRFSF
jgi:hypothetical protein